MGDDSLGTQTMAAVSNMFQCGSVYMNFYSHRTKTVTNWGISHVLVGVSGWQLTAKLRKWLSESKLLPDGLLSLCVHGRHWSARLVKSKGFT